MLEKQSKRKEEKSKKIRQQRRQEYTKNDYLRCMSLTEAVKTIRRRMEMMDVDNNYGRQRK